MYEHYNYGFKDFSEVGAKSGPGKLTRARLVREIVRSILPEVKWYPVHKNSIYIASMNQEQLAEFEEQIMIAKLSGEL